LKLCRHSLVMAASEEAERRRDKLSLRRKEGRITSDLNKVRTTVEKDEKTNYDVCLAPATTAPCERSCAKSDNR